MHFKVFPGINFTELWSNSDLISNFKGLCINNLITLNNHNLMNKIIFKKFSTLLILFKKFLGTLNLTSFKFEIDAGTLWGPGEIMAERPGQNKLVPDCLALYGDRSGRQVL